MIPKSTRERWRAQLTSLTQPLPYTVKVAPDGFVLIDANGFWVADFVRSPRSDVETLASAPEAMSQLLDENARLRELIKEMCGIAVMSLNYLDRNAETKAARIAAVASEIGDE